MVLLVKKRWKERKKKTNFVLPFTHNMNISLSCRSSSFSCVRSAVAAAVAFSVHAVVVGFVFWGITIYTYWQNCVYKCLIVWLILIMGVCECVLNKIFSDSLESAMRIMPIMKNYSSQTVGTWWQTSTHQPVRFVSSHFFLSFSINLWLFSVL